MGDRCVIVVKDENSFPSAGVYLHWNGYNAVELLTQAIPYMRKGDPDYSTARLIGCLHAVIEGNLGLGVLPAPSQKDAEHKFTKYSHGDAGVLVYDCGTGKLEAFSGYLTDEKIPSDLPLPPP